MRRYRGLSLIELLVVLAVAAVLAGVGFVQFNYGASSTNQAAQVVAAAINQARFEAIRLNDRAWFTVTAADANQNGTVVVCGSVDGATGPVCGANARDVSVVRLSGGALERARIQAPSELTIFFDRRGIVLNPAGAGQDITITDRAGGNVRTVTVLPTGRTEIQ